MNLPVIVHHNVTCHAKYRLFRVSWTTPFFEQLIRKVRKVSNRLSSREEPGNWKKSMFYLYIIKSRIPLAFPTSFRIVAITTSSRLYPRHMPSKSLVPSNPGGPNRRHIVDALIRVLKEQFRTGAAISTALVRRVIDPLKNNILAILSGALTVASLPVLLPSLAVSLVHQAGFTATGVVAGALGL